MATLPHGNATVRGSLARALAAMPPDPRDAALVHLAERYARDLDEGGDLSRVGPAFQRSLAALGLTPEARKAVTTPEAKGGASDGPPDQLAQLRARARQR